MSPEEVTTLVASWLDVPVFGVAPLAGAVENLDFMVETEDGDIIMKIGPEQTFVAEAWGCARARSLGIPAPEVVMLRKDVPRSGRGKACLLLRRIPGAALTPGANPILTEAGRQLKCLHSLRIHDRGYGTLARGTHPTWANFTAEPLGHLDELVSGEVLSAPLASRVRKALESHQDAVTFDGPGALLHGDLKPMHIFASEDQLTGIIDWGDVAIGDPLFDLARFSMAGSETLAMVLDGYGLDPSPAVDRALAVYRIIFLTMNLVNELRSGGDWFDSYRAGIEADLAVLA